MKKIILLAVSALLLFGSCKDDSAKIVGEWTYVESYVSDNFVGFELIITETTINYDNVLIFDYTYKDGTIRNLAFPDDPITRVVSVDNNTLILEDINTNIGGVLERN